MLAQNLNEALLSKKKSKINVAAAYFVDGLRCRHIDHHMEPKRLRVYNLVHSRVYGALYMLVALCHLLLALVEDPSGFDDKAGAKANEAVIFYTILGSYVVYSVDAYLQLYMLGEKGFKRNKWLQWRIIFMLCSLLNDLASFMAPAHVPRVFRLLRPYYLIERMRNVRKIVSSILRSVPKIATAISLVIFHVFFFGVFAFLFFSGMHSPNDSEPASCSVVFDEKYEYCSVFSKNCTDYYGSLVASMLHLFTLLTTANYPDVMMPVYDCNPWFALFFIIYLSIGLYFLLNLVLAVTYTHFQYHSKEKVKKDAKKRVIALKSCFLTLSRDRREFALNGKPKPRLRRTSTVARTMVVSDSAAESLVGCEDIKSVVYYDDFLELVSTTMPTLPKKAIRVIFGIVDSDNLGFVNVAQFFRLASFVTIVAEPRPKPSSTVFYIFPKSCRLGKAFVKVKGVLTKIFEKNWVQVFFDALVFVNTILILMEFTWPSKYDKAGFDLNAQSWLLLVFVFEMLGRMAAFGFVGFWKRSFFNKMDLFLIPLACIGETSVLSTFFSRALTLVRMLRLFRSLRLLKVYSSIVTTFVDIIPAMGRYLAVCMSLFYVFSLIGMELFAGKLVETNEAVLQSSFGKSRYWSNNFDSLITNGSNIWRNCWRKSIIRSMR